MTTTLRPLASLPLSELCALYNASFADYVVDLRVDEELLLREMVLEGVDAAASRLAYVDGNPAGVALVARSGWDARVSAMALVPSARGRGAGRTLLEAVIAHAGAAGVRHIELEVIDGNERALSLYESAGFRRLRRLLSFELDAVCGGIAVHPNEIDIADVARTMAAHGPRDLPWQVRAETLARLVPPARGFVLDGAQAVVSDPEQDPVRIRAVVTEPGSRRLGRAAALLGGLMARYPESRWLVPALCPEEAAGLFTRLGFRRAALSQYQMVLDLV
jgi:ribosomal protein S18 acetylase RimI-like enzyme